MDAHVQHVSPAKGGVEGGSLLMVGGVGFSERSGRLSYLVCRFNSSMVSARYDSEHMLHCITPEHAAGMVSVEVKMIRQQLSTDGAQCEHVEVSLHVLHAMSFFLKECSTNFQSQHVRTCHFLRFLARPIGILGLVQKAVVWRCLVESRT